MNNYTFEEHIHNFAVWTAARAVGRNFTGTSSIKLSIEASGLRKFAAKPISISRVEFDELHRHWSCQLIKKLQPIVGNEATYGRAAKIIAIYLKTSVILSNKEITKAIDFIHPPIDAILLNSIAKKRDIPELKNVRWTKLNEKEYWDLVDKLRAAIGSFDWRLEYYWNPDGF